MEIELKFQLPSGERRRLAAWLREHDAQAERLQARYFDTRDRALARAGIALRLRKEGRHWVQTLKTAAHGGALVRTEHNVPLARGKSAPELDIERHRGCDGWASLKRALRRADGPLQARYGTDMRRLAARLSHGRARIEYALDTGAISPLGDAGDSSQVLAVSELELELLSGPPAALFDAARRLLQHWPLWIDVRSKAMRGESVANGCSIVPPVHAAGLAIDARTPLWQVRRDALAECLRHLTPNLSQIAAPEGCDPGHVHQARVALRRLRSARALFGPHPAEAADSEPIARSLGRQLAASRDQAVMAERLWPALRAAGAPLVELPLPADDSSPAAAIQQAPVQQWLLGLLAATLATPAGKERDEQERWSAVLPTLERWHAQCRKDARRFKRLDAERRHRLRKRLKRLRYGVEFIAAALPASRQATYARRLAEALQALGDYNDLHTAIGHYRAAAEQSPQALFAVGWLAARLDDSDAHCRGVLAKFARVAPPWA